MKLRQSDMQVSEKAKASFVLYCMMKERMEFKKMK